MLGHIKKNFVGRGNQGYSPTATEIIFVGKNDVQTQVSPPKVPSPERRKTWLPRPSESILSEPNTPRNPEHKRRGV
jgi:hypothetical protein